MTVYQYIQTLVLTTTCSIFRFLSSRDCCVSISYLNPEIWKLWMQLPISRQKKADYWLQSDFMKLVFFFNNKIQRWGCVVPISSYSVAGLELQILRGAHFKANTQEYLRPPHSNIGAPRPMQRASEAMASMAFGWFEPCSIAYDWIGSG